MTYTTEEIIQHRRDWIAALRSGKYQQATGLLHTMDDRFCCLGVACDLAQVESSLNVSGDAYGYGEYGGYLVLPEEGQDWLGVLSESPDLDVPDGMFAGPDADYSTRSLAGLNDEGLPFHQIADLIEYFGLEDDGIGGWKA